ncbi:unnamed protein product, partial [Prorocentrum cordatum]
PPPPSPPLSFRLSLSLRPSPRPPALPLPRRDSPSSLRARRHVASMGGEGLYICKEVLAAAGVEESSHTAGGACYVSGLCPDNASVCSTAVPPRQQSCSSYQATTLGSGSSTEMTRNRGLDEWQHGLPSASGSEWRSLAPTPAAAVREEAGEAQAAAEAVLALGSSESSGLQRESWQMRLSVGSEAVAHCDRLPPAPPFGRSGILGLLCPSLPSEKQRW